jgi:hypothetical protein
LAADVRHTLRPERFLSIRRSLFDGVFTRPGETAAEAAERILRLELISCGTPHRFEGDVDWTANPTVNQYDEWPWQLNRHPEWVILAERYRATGDERYAECFVKLFTSWVRQAVVPENAPGNTTICWRTIEAGIRMGGSWQWALHSFVPSPHLTDDVLVDWYKSVWEHGRRLRSFHRRYNWLIMEMNGLAQIGILYPQYRDASAWKTYAFERLTEELDEQVYPDGFQYELTTEYHQVVVNNYEWLWQVCDAYDEPVPDAWKPHLERMHAANVRLMMPDGRLPDLNDGRWAPVSRLMEPAVLRYPRRADFRWARSGGKDGTPPAETSLAFPYAGYFVMRTGWEADAVWALFDGGPFGAAHQHEDKLNLLLHAYGQLLLTEGGNYAYDDSDMRRYVLSTRAHNTIRIDRQDQNRHRHFRRETIDISAPAPAWWRTTDDFDAVEALYDEGYGPEATRTGTHHRRVIFLKRGIDQLGVCVLVIDRLLPADEAVHEYEAIWHLECERAAVIGLTASIPNASQPGLRIIPSALSNPTCEVLTGRETTEWQGWKGYGDHLQGQFEATPTAIYRWSSTVPTRLVTLLYPLRTGEQCPVQRIDAASDVAETAVRLTLFDGGEITLDERDYLEGVANHAGPLQPA